MDALCYNDVDSDLAGPSIVLQVPTFEKRRLLMYVNKFNVSASLGGMCERYVLDDKDYDFLFLFQNTRWRIGTPRKSLYMFMERD